MLVLDHEEFDVIDKCAQFIREGEFFLAEKVMEGGDRRVRYY